MNNVANSILSKDSASKPIRAEIMRHKSVDDDSSHANLNQKNVSISIQTLNWICFIETAKLERS